MPATPANEFLAGLGGVLGGKPIEKALHGMYSATTGRLPCAALTLFKPKLHEHCYGVSNPPRGSGLAGSLAMTFCARPFRAYDWTGRHCC